MKLISGHKGNALWKIILKQCDLSYKNVQYYIEWSRDIFIRTGHKGTQIMRNVMWQF